MRKRPNKKIYNLGITWCLKCEKMTNDNIWKKIKEGIFVGQCNWCKTRMVAYMYEKGKIVADKIND